MPARIKKYNPGFLSEDELVASFCVRGAELESLIDSLRASTGASNSHTLVIGPRGSGKTYLLRRVAAETGRDPSLSVFRPVFFAEESYEVSTVGEFWLECLDHLAEQAPEDECAGLRLSHGDIKAAADDRELADRCLGAILAFADRQGERIMLVVENLNMVFADMADPEAGWRIRHTLQTEPRILLLGSATSRFDEIDHPEHALYDLFQVITLRPLDTEGCLALWQAVSGRNLKGREGRAVRPLEILTGGNPRLVTIVAGFGASLSLEHLMESLLDLVDDHTDYFKGHLESLPAQERRVYLALARLWKPATAREVADQSRTSSSLCSALLKRLIDRGAVAIEGGTPRRRRYYLTERLYNIYYLLRRGGGASRVVQALIEFMICMYSISDLWDALRRFYGGRASMTGTIPVEMALHLAESTLSEVSHLEGTGDLRGALDACDAAVSQLDAIDIPGKEAPVTMLLMNRVLLLNESGRANEALGACDAAVARFESSAFPELVQFVYSMYIIKATILVDQKRISAAIYTAEQALCQAGRASQIDRHQLEAGAVSLKAMILYQHDRNVEADALMDKLIDKFELYPSREMAVIIVMALSGKGCINDLVLSEREFSMLLSAVSLSGVLKPDTVNALIRFSSAAGPDRALELIEASPESALLLPLATALKCELNVETNVSKEVAEVAEDVRRAVNAGVRARPSSDS